MPTPSTPPLGSKASARPSSRCVHASSGWASFGTHPSLSPDLSAQEANEERPGIGHPLVCCLACAGGIVNNTVDFTNIKTGWKIDGEVLATILEIPVVTLINDFEAQGYGLLTLGDREVHKLNNGAVRAGAPIACVGAGTGLGECFLTADATSGNYTCWPCEGGHAEFSPRDQLGVDFLVFLKSLHSEKKRVSIERICSGPGLCAIYHFLRQHWAFAELTNPKIEAAMDAAPAHKQAKVIADGSKAGDIVCKKAVSIFCTYYGSELGVAALKYLPYGGLYISGGIAAKNPDWITSEEFQSAYKDKGRLSPLVEQIPLYQVKVEDTGERGALFVACKILCETKGRMEVKKAPPTNKFAPLTTKDDEGVTPTEPVSPKSVSRSSLPSPSRFGGL